MREILVGPLKTWDCLAMGHGTADMDPKSQKQIEKLALKKTVKTQPCQKWVSGCKMASKLDTSSVPETSQNHNNPQNPQNGPQGAAQSLQNDKKSWFWPPKVKKTHCKTV